MNNISLKSLRKTIKKTIKKNKINYPIFKQDSSKTTFGISVAALLIVQILISIVGFVALFKCSKVKQWPTWLTVLLIVLFFVPGINFFVIIFLIIYFFVTPCY